jgi:predicted AlkP superfamily phosphohydrolase/phosphomutase
MKTLLLGFDAFSPLFFERLYEQGKLPNLGSFVEQQRYAHFEVSNPPQSEVSWTSIATGLNPGEHGMFDFVHRDPLTYNLHVSLLPTQKGLGGVQFVRPSTARTIFDMAADQGYPATSLWWPATFPARPELPVRTLPGLGTPDIQGRLGIGCLYSTDGDLPDKLGKTPVKQLKKVSADHYSSALEGPMLKAGQNAALPFDLRVLDEQRAELRMEKQTISLKLGAWSPVIELRFKLGLLVSVHALTRLVITKLTPQVQFYVLPLQIHPLRPLWRYGTPASFVKEAWKDAGPFLTLGWPQDTTGLEDGCINDEQFLALCDSIFERRYRLLMSQLSNFHEGLLASVFDTLDRVQHMFWYDRPDVLERWYRRLDGLVGEVQRRLASHNGKPARLLIVSDHGFQNFDYKVHLNRWLIQQGFLTPQQENAENLKAVDWSRSQAYALGLNSLYLNVAGREGQGSLAADQRQERLENIRQVLLGWRGPDGRKVVQNVYLWNETFTGALTAYGPDMLVGYAPGYRASAETGLGGWKSEAVEPNHDHWHADHCIDPAAVPGVLFTNFDLKNFPSPSYREIPALAIDASPDARNAAPPPMLNQEDQEKVEERLKSLGYL